MVKLSALNVAEKCKVYAAAFHRIQYLFGSHIKRRQRADMSMRINYHSITLQSACSLNIIANNKNDVYNNVEKYSFL